MFLIFTLTQLAFLGSVLDSLHLTMLAALVGEASSCGVVTESVGK